MPNKEFITGRLLNWTLSDAKVRTVIPVGIAYGSDVELAIKTRWSRPKMVPCRKHKGLQSKSDLSA